MGCQGYEFTAELHVLCDMLGCKLVHGWLIDPVEDGPAAAAAGTRTYNELMDGVIAGKEAEAQLSKLQTEIEELRLHHPHLMNGLDLLDDSPDSAALAAVHEKLEALLKDQNNSQEAATASHLIERFLAESSHQLTIYGLEQLHTTLSENDIAVFFRNNHFGSITKHGEQLYLLITDLGYANTPDIVWEKLDVVDGDTEFCNSQFSHNGAVVVQSGPTLTPEQLMASSSQNDADYHLALHLSMQGNRNAAVPSLDEQEGQIVAAATEASLREYHGLPANLAISAGTIAAMPGVSADASIEVGVPIHPQMNASGDGLLLQEAADRMLALQLQKHHTDDRTPSSADAASLRLAQQLQQQEYQRPMVAPVTENAESRQRARQNSSMAASQNCAIM